MKYKSFFTAFVICLLATLFGKDVSAQDSTDAAKAKITLSFAVQDSIREVKAVLTQRDAKGVDTFVKDVEMHFYVKKSFGLLPLEGESTTTDENGEASVEFPTDLPGDTQGNVTVIARVEDNDELGDVQASKIVKWGVATPAAKQETTRALWSSGNNAPWILVIVVSGLVAAVWGVIVYIFFQLIRINRSGKFVAGNTR